MVHPFFLIEMTQFRQRPIRCRRTRILCRKRAGRPHSSPRPRALTQWFATQGDDGAVPSGAAEPSIPPILLHDKRTPIETEPASTAYCGLFTTQKSTYPLGWMTALQSIRLESRSVSSRVRSNSGGNRLHLTRQSDGGRHH